MSLPSELGPQYIQEHIVGAVFRRENEIAYVRGCDSRRLVVSTFDLTNKEAIEWVNKDYPHSALNSFKDMAWPRLGYRNLESDAVFGNVVAYLTTTRSVHRGLREEGIEYYYPEVYSALYWPARTYHPASNTLYRLQQIFDPTWIKFSEGMKRIKDMEIPGFALNEDLAVAVSIDQGPNRFCDMLFRNRVVGHVAEDNTLDLANVTLKRSSLKRLHKLMET
jgi:hypothetical protein